METQVEDRFPRVHRGRRFGGWLSSTPHPENLVLIKRLPAERECRPIPAERRNILESFDGDFILEFTFPRGGVMIASEMKPFP